MGQIHTMLCPPSQCTACLAHAHYNVQVCWPLLFFTASCSVTCWEHTHFPLGSLSTLRHTIRNYLTSDDRFSLVAFAFIAVRFPICQYQQLSLPPLPPAPPLFSSSFLPLSILCLLFLLPLLFLTYSCTFHGILLDFRIIKFSPAESFA